MSWTPDPNILILEVLTGIMEILRSAVGCNRSQREAIRIYIVHHILPHCSSQQGIHRGREYLG